MKKTVAGETVEVNPDGRAGGFTVHLIRRCTVPDLSHSNDFEVYFLGRLTQREEEVWLGEGERAIRGAFAAPTQDGVIEQMILAFCVRYPRAS